MKRETIVLGNGRIEVLIDGNLIYLNIFGEYTDDDVIALTKYLEKFFAEIDGPTIRVCDGTNIPEDGFKLTAKGTDKFAEWSRRIKKKWPDNVAYLIGDKPLKYGVSRMYAIKASSDDLSIIAVHSIDELPENIKERILRK